MFWSNHSYSALKEGVELSKLDTLQSRRQLVIQRRQLLSLRSPLRFSSGSTILPLTVSALHRGSTVAVFHSVRCSKGNPGPFCFWRGKISTYAVASVRGKMNVLLGRSKLGRNGRRTWDKCAHFPRKTR